jgi:hypothetical protein
MHQRAHFVANHDARKVVHWDLGICSEKLLVDGTIEQGGQIFRESVACPQGARVALGQFAAV